MRTTLLSALVLFCNVLCAQTQCEVWQWTRTDSAHKILAKTQRFDANGHLLFARSTGFVHNPIYGPELCDYIYTYSDTVLNSLTVTIPEQDSFRYVYAYDFAGRLVHTTDSRKDHVPEDTVRSGKFNITRVSVDTTEGKWKFYYETRITYSRWGRKILEEENSPRYHWRRRGTWEYDEKGRVIKYTYYTSGKMYWCETYTYFDGGYNCEYTWYDDEERIVKSGHESLPYQEKKTMIVKTDANGNIIEAKNVDYKGKQIDRKTYSYNTEGKIMRERYYDKKDKQVLTHMYLYK